MRRKIRKLTDQEHWNWLAIWQLITITSKAQLQVCLKTDRWRRKHKRIVEWIEDNNLQNTNFETGECVYALIGIFSKELYIGSTETTLRKRIYDEVRRSKHVWE